MWPKLYIVHGKSTHPQSQGSIERENGDIKDMPVSWVADNNSTEWVKGMKFVQFPKNCLSLRNQEKSICYNCRALQFLACTLQLHSCVRLSLNINNHEV